MTPLKTILGAAWLAQLTLGKPAINQRTVTSACEKSINCEVVHKDGIPRMAFKRDMGPGSEWYNTTIESRSFDLDQPRPMNKGIVERMNEWFPMLNPNPNPNRNNRKRAEGDCLDDLSVPVCTIISMSEGKIFYGDVHPRAMADGIWEHCTPDGPKCDEPWDSEPTRDGTRGGYKTIKLIPDGDYTRNTEWALKFMITQLADTKVEKIERGGPAQGHVADWSYWAYRGPKEVQVARHVWAEFNGKPERALQGTLSLRFEEEDKDTDTCEAILGALAEVPHVGGLGALSPVCGWIM